MRFLTSIAICLCVCFCVVCKQVTSFLCCIKVSSLPAPQEKQRAGGSLGRSALPWATYQTAWMSVGVCVSVCVFTESKGCRRKSGRLSRLNTACLYTASSTVIVLCTCTYTGWSGWKRANQVPADETLEKGSEGEIQGETGIHDGRNSKVKKCNQASQCSNFLCCSSSGTACYHSFLQAIWEVFTFKGYRKRGKRGRQILQQHSNISQLGSG